MAHERQQDFCKKVKYIFPEYFKDVRVCDIGSLDINGNNHYLFENYDYVGIDVGEGDNVTYVGEANKFVPLSGQKYNIVISTECFEHDMHWVETMHNVCDNLLADKGLFLFTCATTGRPEHGTNRSKPHDSPLTLQHGEWSDYYMNLTALDVKNNVDLDKYFSLYHFYTDMESCDLYFWGIKK